MTSSSTGKGSKNKKNGGKNNKNKNKNNNGNDPPGLRHRHNSNKAKKHRSRRLSNLVDDLPFTSREFVTAALSKDDVMKTYDHIAEHQHENFNKIMSVRSLDVTTEKYAKAISTRNLNINNISDDDNVDDGGELGLAASRSIQEDQQQDIEEDDTSSEGGGGGCCAVWKSFEQEPTAKGYSMLGVARGTILMSNVFLSTSLIFLASVQAGCVDLEINQRLDECDGKAYGFKPTSLISNISVISGLLAAFFVPVFGAVIDYTPHRRLVGIVSAISLTLIQGIQIGTVQQTWFVMAWLQAIAGFLFFVQVMATFAYLPEMARNVGGDTMNHYTKWFTFIQFLTQLLFLIVVIIPGFIFSMDNVMTAQLGQAISTIAIFIGFTYSTLGGIICPTIQPYGIYHKVILYGLKDSDKITVQSKSLRNIIKKD